ncbi:putative RNA-directed DNA polymerase from transposon BS [Stylophora pistillata]|uniref:Putative RNA-directed DNA polymerase from transposon BS n=1 Tax=Stylophora pistillata TaxID=50429 RepID=A0A2B4RHR8_STYPI|nr:putative RNA-directed DNA polymerase from transposon BS [Stylophora pistillata]
MVDREILLQKLNAYGLTPVARKWFSSYLTDRHQFIALDNVTSDSALVRHGVPQGSILGPLLFVIYINDLPLHVNGADLDLYADDTTLTLSADISAVDSLQDSLAASLKEIECWTHTNKLPLNEKKTKTLLVTGKRLGKKLPDGYNLSLKTMNGVSLEQVPSAKLLDKHCGRTVMKPAVHSRKQNLEPESGVGKRKVRTTEYALSVAF